MAGTQPGGARGNTRKGAGMAIQPLAQVTKSPILPRRHRSEEKSAEAHLRKSTEGPSTGYEVADMAQKGDRARESEARSAGTYLGRNGK